MSDPAPRHRRTELPPSPLDFAEPLRIRGVGAEGAAILDEVPPPHAAALLRAYRAVLGWCRGEGSAAEPRRKAAARWLRRLRAPHPPAELTDVAQSFADELARRDVRADVLADACERVRAWAASAGAEHTALLFAEAAALVQPTNGRAAWSVGRMFRDFGHPRPAELWLNRAIRVARWNGDVETHDLALNSLGNLFCQQGCYREAERHLTRALHVAAALDRARRGCVSHDLMAVSIALEDFSRAEDFASAAVRLYGPDHPNLPRLGFDIAVLWIRQGKFAAAFPVLQALSSRLTSVNERLHVLGATARTAGALGDREAFLTAWRDVWTQLATGGPESRMASAEIVLDLALGAAALHDAERARSAFEEAIREAQATKQLDVAAHAEAGLQALRAGEHFGPIARPASTPAANLSKAVTYALAVGSSFTVGLNCGGRST